MSKYGTKEYNCCSLLCRSPIYLWGFRCCVHAPAWAVILCSRSHSDHSGIDVCARGNSQNPCRPTKELIFFFAFHINFACKSFWHRLRLHLERVCACVCARVRRVHPKYSLLHESTNGVNSRARAHAHSCPWSISQRQLLSFTSFKTLHRWSITSLSIWDQFLGNAPAKKPEKKIRRKNHTANGRIASWHKKYRLARTAFAYLRNFIWLELWHFGFDSRPYITIT